MGFTMSENADLATNQLKDVAQTWYVKLKDNRPLRGGLVTWEIFKKSFLDQFFCREMGEAKVVEFINLRQGGMTVLEYSLKLTKLSKYGPSFVADPRDEISRFVTKVLKELQEQFYSAMLHYNMKFSLLIVQIGQVEEARAKRKSRHATRERSFDNGSSKGRFNIQDKPRFKRRLSNQVPSKFPKSRDDKGNKLRAKTGRSGNLPNEKPICVKCGKGHLGE